MLRSNLDRILTELSTHHRSKTELLTVAISDRLDKSIAEYYKELTNSIRFLSDKNELRLLKKLNKE